jgi:serine/threonine-protein kinase
VERELATSEPSARVDASRASATATESQGARLALVRAAWMAIGAWPAFAALDVYMALVLFPVSRLGLVLFYRALGEAINLAGLFVCRHPRVTLRQAYVVHAITYASMGLLISLMSLELGGLHSRYVHGVSIVVMVRAIVVPARAGRSLAWSLPVMLSFPCVHAIAGHLVGVTESAFSPHRAAVFASDYVFLVGSTVVGSAAGHLIWTAEQQLFRARKLGRYRLEAPIARGGMGEIWLASDEGLRRQVALKILRQGPAMGSAAIQRFEREAKAASNLSSPHTIRIFDYGATEDGLRFIVMEHLVGADLGKLVEQHGPLPVGRAVSLVRQACESLREAHERGIIHRDIKPQNLFVTRAGEQFDWVKLLDFGIVRLSDDDDDLTRPGVVPGTPAYVAPELWAGGRADVRSDVYALGATLHFLLTARTPSASDDRDSGFVSRQRGSDVPEALERVVARCLAREPSARYASVAEVDEALASVPLAAPWTAEDARSFWLVTHPETRARWSAQTEA